MQLKPLFIFFLILTSTLSGAQEFLKETISLWQKQNIPFNRENIAIAESVDSAGRRITQISNPKLFIYRKKNAPQDGPALLFIPGGGYAVVSLRKEGEAIARHFHQMGFSLVAVLKYRLPDERMVIQPHKVPLCDAQKALSLIYQNAEKWQINRHKMAVMGSSAGGHLAASLANLSDDVVAPGVKAEELEQAVSVLMYPVITFNLPYRHKGSYKRLLAEKHNQQAMLDYYSIENQVSENTPPTYLVHALDDAVVVPENSKMYCDSLKKFAVPCHLQLLERGGHGFGLNFKKTGIDWTIDLEKWLRENTKLFKNE